eukprot:8251705-Alexandrium_andersonii.AAC.1
MQQYMQQSAVPSPWSCVPGWHLSNTFWDDMHNIYLGFGRDVAASAIAEWLIEGKLRGHSADLALHRLWLEFREWSKQTYGVKPQGTFSLGKLNLDKGTEWAELSTTYKAVTVKWILLFLAIKSGQLDGECTSYHSHVRSTCLWALARYIRVCDRGGLLLEPSEARKAQTAGK